jgi:NitT/TauT family transport system substrate-binding protein
MRLAAALLAALLAVRPAVAAQGTPVALGYTAVNEYLPAFVAADAGIFAAHHVDVTLRLLPNGGVIPPGLVSDSLQIGGITAPLLLQAASGGLDLVVIAGGSVVRPENPNGSVVGRADTKIRAPADFIGTRVGVSAVGSFYHVLFRQWLADAGVDPARVVFVEVPFNQMGDLLHMGQVDAVTTTQPFIGRLVASGVGHEIAPFTAHFPAGLLSNLYVATRAWAGAHPAQIAGFRAALAEAVAYIPAHKQQAEAAEAHYLKLTADQVIALPFSNYDARVTPAQIDAWNRIARAQGLIDTDVPAASVLWP